MAYIINALFFEAEWATIYENIQVKNGTFTTENGNEQTVKMMSSTEHQFVELKSATGFMKNYKKKLLNIIYFLLYYMYRR